jgi:photosystem II stability/assembly factor-like uncharacterized protein
MSKDRQFATELVLDALRGIINDHGDRFTWAVSKAGRIWLTLTHWDTVRYSTSVELGGMSEVSDMLGGLCVLIVAHRGKCFGSVDKGDSWTTVEQTSRLSSEAFGVLQSQQATVDSSDSPAAPEPADADQVITVTEHKTK